MPLDGAHVLLIVRAMRKTRYKRPGPGRAAGFTLLELMLVITIAALILGIGVPNMRQFILNNRMTAAANDLLAAVYTARGEAVKRNTQVMMCFSTSPRAATPDCNGDGTQGWVVFVDAADVDVAAATDNNGVVDGGEPVLLRHDALPGTIRVQSRPAGNKGYVAFNAAGFSRQIPSVGTGLAGVVMCDARGNVELYGADNSAARGVLISQTGRPRVTRSVDEIENNVFLDGCP